MGLFNVDTWLPVAASGLLIMLYGATLVKACRGSKYKFVVKLLILLILSNVALILNYLSYYWWFQTDFSNRAIVWISLLSISGFLLIACFNLSYWMFAFEYYSIARFMPFVLKGQDLPESKLKCDGAINKIMLFLNIAAPLVN